MAIKLPQGFEITSKQPIDTRLTLTKAEMVSTVDVKMPNVYFAVCKDDGKLYTYNINNTVDPTTGKFRLYAEGGGGSGLVDDVKVDGVSVVTNKVANIDLATPLALKQDKLTAGTNITITEDSEGNHIISATGGASVDFDNKTIIKGTDNKFQTAIGGWKEVNESLTPLFIDTKGTGLPTYIGPTGTTMYEVGWDYDTTITSLVGSATEATIKTKFTVLGSTFEGNVVLYKQTTIPYIWQSNDLTIGGSTYVIKVQDQYTGINNGGLTLVANDTSADLSDSVMNSLALVVGGASVIYHPIDNKFLKLDADTMAVNEEGELTATLSTSSLAEKLPGAIAEAMQKEGGAEQVLDAMFNTEHFQTTIDNKIDLAINLIQAVESN